MTTGHFALLAVASLALLGLGFVAGYALAMRGEELASEAAKAVAAAKTSRAPISWLSNIQPRAGTAGFTIAAALNGVGCLGRSAADEPVFVLCSRDKAASMAVRDWAALAEKLGAQPAKVREARELADRMEEWRQSHGGGKIPD